MVPNDHGRPILGIQMLLAFDLELDPDERVNHVIKRPGDVMVCVEPLEKQQQATSKWEERQPVSAIWVEGWRGRREKRVKEVRKSGYLSDEGKKDSYAESEGARGEESADVEGEVDVVARFLSTPYEDTRTLRISPSA
jgi:hypothetical protein